MAKRRGNSEGSLHQRPNGSWRAQLTLQGHRLSYTNKSRRECQEWIRRTKDQIDEGLTYASTKLKLADYLMSWMTIKKTIMRPTTWDQYSQLIRTYINPNIGDVILKELRTDHIQGLYTRLIDQQVGIPTIRKIHKLLHSSLESSAETGLVSRNPASYAHPPQEPFKERVCLNETQVSQFLLEIKGHRWEALFHLALTTGMRLRELLALKWEDLDWVQQSLQVNRQLSKKPNSGDMFLPLKTKSSRRSIALGDETIRVLREHYDHQWSQRIGEGNTWVDCGLIFTNSKGGPMCAGCISQGFKKLLVSAGIPPMRFHDIRHTYATLLIQHGTPPTTVARQLGHSRTSTTLDVYSHVIDGQQREAAMLMDKIITPIKLHPNCTQLNLTDQNATKIDDLHSFLAKNPNIDPK